MNWYNSDLHRGLMQQLGGGGRPDGPLADVPEDVPVLAIASLTFNGGAQTGGEMKNQLSQIAIELYTTLPGGLAVGGRFAPAALKVPGLVDLPLAALGK